VLKLNKAQRRSQQKQGKATGSSAQPNQTGNNQKLKTTRLNRQYISNPYQPLITIYILDFAA
jgi:hypothetical protein